MGAEHSKMVEDILNGVGWDTQFEANYEEVEDNHVYIIGLDPGETTGFAVVRLDPSDKKALPELLFLDQIPGGRYGFKNYFGNYWLDERTVVVSEQWKERNKKGANREPQYIEGSMHMLWGDENIVYQYPDVKSLVPDEFLIEQGVWTPGKRHQMDALIHILVFLRNGGEGNEGVADALGGEGGEGQGTMGEISDFAEGDGEGAGDGDQAGQSMSSFAEGKYHKYHETQTEARQGDTEGQNVGYVVEDPKGKRKERELDGAFAGFVSAEAESGAGTVLLDD